MIIGLDAKRFFTNATGLGTYARTTIQALARYQKGLRLILYTPQAGGPYAHQVPPEATVISPRLPRSLAPLWRSFALPRDVARAGVHIYHGLSHELPLVPLPHGVRSVVTVHDLLFLSHPHRYPAVDRLLYRVKYQASIAKAHCVLAISQATRQELMDRLAVPAERIRVVYQACPEVYFGPPPVPPQKARRQMDLPQGFVLFVGSLIPRKGAATLVEALGRLPRSQRPALVLAGTGPLEASLRQQAQRLGVSATFLGHVAAELLPGLYAAAELLAYPSEAEGFGLPIVEALACGTPVVTSTGSCFAEAGGPGAIYTPPADAERLAQAMARVLEDSALAENLRQAGRAHVVANFHPQAVAARLAAIYRELLEAPCTR